MKKLTLILPDSIDVLEITCFWRAKNGHLIKSMMVIDGRSHEDGDEINCYLPLSTEVGKEEVLMINAQKFMDVFGFDLRDKIKPSSDVYKWLMKLYKEPKDED